MIDKNRFILVCGFIGLIEQMEKNPEFREIIEKHKLCSKKRKFWEYLRVEKSKRRKFVLPYGFENELTRLYEIWIEKVGRKIFLNQIATHENLCEALFGIFLVAKETQKSASRAQFLAKEIARAVESGGFLDAFRFPYEKDVFEYISSAEMV